MEMDGINDEPGVDGGYVDGGDVDARAAELEARLAGLEPFGGWEEGPPPEGIGDFPGVYEAEVVDRVRLDVRATAGELGATIGDALKGRFILFRRDGGVVARTIWGTWEQMEPVWFSTWLTSRGFAVMLGKKGGGEEIDLPESLGARILRSEALLSRLPRLTGVNAVRLPVFRAGGEETGWKQRTGFRKLELLPVGYDEETGIWTEPGVEYPDDWDQDTAREYFDGLFRYFEFSDPDRLAVQFAAMFSVYCRDLFVGRPPMFVWNSNLAGSGKSTLSRMPLRFVLGRASPLVLDQRNRRELQQELNTAAMAYADAVWFDDVVGKIHAPELRVWITEGHRAGRVLGGNRMFDVPVRAVTFVTGAQLTIDEHMARRSLWVDLFPTEQLASRKLPPDAVRITEGWMGDLENRRKFLAAMWAAVRHWDHCHRPRGSRMVDSLEGWSEVVPGIVAANGWGDCLARFEAPDAGDLDAMEAGELIRAVIREYGDRGVCDQADIISTARINGLFRHVLGELDLLVADLDTRPRWRWQAQDPDGIPTDVERRRQAARWRDERVDARWGKLWKRLACGGLTFEVDGQRWRFGTRRSAAKMLYDLVKVGEPLDGCALPS